MVSVVNNITIRVFEPEQNLDSDSSVIVSPTGIPRWVVSNLSSDVSLLGSLKSTLQKVLSRGCISALDIRHLDNLLGLGGPQWLCEKLLQVQHYVSLFNN